ncbi:uncharacterized protein [Ptychodera flava]|uniref:uncharacterized protein isoform X2 n=1 Tax=Ptychodera flava TaxID=63121 RepID=UPI00396A591D
MMSGIGMKDEHRQLLRRLKPYLVERLDAKKTTEYMPDIFSQEDEQWITHIFLTPQDSTRRFIDFFLRKGPHAFQSFVRVCDQLYPDIAVKLREESGLPTVALDSNTVTDYGKVDTVNEAIKFISKRLTVPQCRAICRDLGLTHVESDTIERQYVNDVETQKFRMFCRWKEKSASRATIDTLRKALDENHCRNQSEELLDHLEKKGYDTVDSTATLHGQLQRLDISSTGAPQTHNLQSVPTSVPEDASSAQGAVSSSLPYGFQPAQPSIQPSSSATPAAVPQPGPNDQTGNTQPTFCNPLQIPVHMMQGHNNRQPTVHGQHQIPVHMQGYNLQMPMQGQYSLQAPMYHYGQPVAQGHMQGYYSSPAAVQGQYATHTHMQVPCQVQAPVNRNPPTSAGLNPAMIDELKELDPFTVEEFNILVTSLKLSQEQIQELEEDKDKLSVWRFYQYWSQMDSRCQEKELVRVIEKKLEREDIGEKLRACLPAGKAGPKQDANKRVMNMNYKYRRYLCMALNIKSPDGLHDWRVVADELGIEPLVMQYYDQVPNPMERVLSDWEVKENTTIGKLYDILVKLDMPQYADFL